MNKLPYYTQIDFRNKTASYAHIGHYCHLKIKVKECCPTVGTEVLNLLPTAPKMSAAHSCYTDGRLPNNL